MSEGVAALAEFLTLPATVVIGPNGEKQLEMSKGESLRFITHPGAVDPVAVAIIRRNGARLVIPWDRIEQIVSHPPELPT